MTTRYHGQQYPPTPPPTALSKSTNNLNDIDNSDVLSVPDPSDKISSN